MLGIYLSGTGNTKHCIEKLIHLIIKASDRKIEKWSEKIKHSKYPKDGLYFFDKIAGFICQRFWCYGKTKDYSDKLKINHNCTGCGLCVSLCPMENLGKKTIKLLQKVTVLCVTVALAPVPNKQLPYWEIQLLNNVAMSDM